MTPPRHVRTKQGRHKHTSFFERVEIWNTYPGAKRLLYMVRWNIIRIRSLGSIRIHHIKLTDTDRGAHDHPWWFIAVILKGGYWENWGRKGEWKITNRRRVRWFSFHRCTDLHKVDEFLNGKDSWSFFITGRVVRDWGFNSDGTWVEADAWIAKRDAEWWETNEYHPDSQ